MNHRDEFDHAEHIAHLERSIEPSRFPDWLAGYYSAVRFEHDEFFAEHVVEFFYHKKQGFPEGYDG